MSTLLKNELEDFLCGELEKLRAERDRLKEVNALLLTALEKLVDRNFCFVGNFVQAGEITRDDIEKARAALAAAKEGK
jgi:hypothetical protein